MKKILALILALAMVFAFAACKGKDNDTDTTTEPAGAVDGTTDAAPVDGSEGSSDATDVSGDASTEAQTTPDGSVVEPSNAGTQQSGTQQGGTQQGGTQQGGTATTKGLNSTDPATVAAFYCKARKATNPVPKGQQTLTLGNNGKIEGEGFVGTIVKLGSGVIDSVLKKNSTETDWIPAGNHADIKASDVKSASAKVNGNYTEVSMTFKEQTDGSDGDSKNGGPVARGVGTLGSIDGALKDLGAEIKSGRENVKLTYVNAKLNCKIDNNTGKIVSGTWSYTVQIRISDATLSFKGLSGSVKNLYAEVNYKVVI